MKINSGLFALIFILEFNVSIFAQFSQIGPYGGYIRCLTKDNLGRIISGNAYGGIFRTADAGQNWEQIFTGYRNEDVRSLAVNSSNHIFAGTDGSGLYRSTDDGVTWERLFNLVYDRTVQDIMIKANGDIFLATFDGVYRSTDNGNTFILVNNGIPTSTIYSLGLFGNNILAGTAGNGIYRSSDDGTNWEEANNGVTFMGRNVLDFSSSEFSDNIGAANIYATLSDKIVRSSDGINWDELSIPPGNYLHLLNRINDDIVATGSSLISSNNQGNNWNVSIVPTDALLSTIVEIDGNTLITGSEGPGSFVSTDNMVNWNIEVQGMPATAVTGISWTADVLNVSTRHSGLFKTTDGAQSWINISSSIPHGWFYGLYQHPTTSTLFALHQNGVYRSINGGADWDLTSAFGKTMEFNSLGNIFLGSGSYISKSTDDGVSYQLKQIDPNVFNSRQIAIDQNDEMIVATANDFGLQGQGVYKSIDLGETYFPYNDGLPNDITSVEYADTNGFYSDLDCLKKLIAADANGNFYSNNDDGSWNQFNIGFQQGGLVLDIAAVNYGEVIIIPAITEREMSSIRITIDDPPTCLFEEETDVLDDVYFSALIDEIHASWLFGAINSEYTYFAGTIGTGVLKKVFLTDVDNKTNNPPSKFELFQNYPNPFNPNTTIKFTISSALGGGFTTLKVYDVLGNQVAILVNEESAIGGAGTYEVNFNAAAISSGVYFYRLTAGDFIKIRKMVLLK